MPAKAKFRTSSQQQASIFQRAAILLTPTHRTHPDEWGAANRVYAETSGVPGPRNPYLTKYMVPFGRKVHEGSHKRVVGVTAAQSGKALALDTPIPTPCGWAQMGDLQVGDLVFGARGDVVRIDRVSPVMHGHDCYAVEFDDGQVIVADAGHIWTVERTDCSGRNRRVVDITTEEMVREGVSRVQSNGRNRFMFSIPVAGELDLPEVDLPVDPYVLGAWLGDGNSRCAALSVGESDLPEMQRILSECGVETRAVRERTCWRLSMFAAGMKHKRSGIQSQLRALGLIGNKHVPSIYLRASASQRLALLQGLMDTDGTVDNGTVASFCSAEIGLSKSVLELAASLGFRPRMRQHKRGHWMVSIQCYRERSIFRMTRKTNALRSTDDAKSRPFINSRRSIVSIRQVESVPVKCIGVSSPDHLYLAGPTMIPTHNTEFVMDCIGARLDQRPAPILYVGPSKDFVQDQFEPRLMELLDQAEVLRAKVARGKRMKKLLKIVAGVRVRLGFAGSSTSLKSDPFGLGFVDEYDEMMANIKGQGDPLGLAEARGDTYADFVTAIVSTPSQGLVETEIDPVSGLEFWAVGDPEIIISPIWRLWQQGTRHHFAWPCPQCEEYFVPRFKHLRWEKGATPAQARRNAWLECPCCGGVIENDHKPEMIAAGVQIAPGQTIEEAREGINEPESDTWSCWTSGLCSPFQTFGDRAARYLTALESGETDKIQTAINAAFGECYDASADADVPAADEVLRHKLPYARNTIPSGAVRLLMAVDVQKFSLIYGIRAFGARGTSWLIDHGQLYGPTDQDDVWAALADLMMTQIDGWQIERVFIDSGFRPDKPNMGNEHKVYEFCRRWSWLCTPTKGKDVQNPPYRVSKIEVKPDGKKALYSIDLAWLSTDFFKSLVVARMKTPMGVPGAFYLHSEVEEDYAKQVTSEARVVEKGKPRWVQRSRDNHFFDVEAMLAAGGYTMNVQRIAPVETDEDEHQAETPAASRTAAAPSPVPAKAEAAKPPGQTRKRFARLGARLNR